MSTQNTQTQTENMNPENIPGNPGPLAFTIPAATLRAAVKACAPTMSNDVNRFILNGLFFELRAAPTVQAIKDGSAPHVLSIVGCDGRRLHVAQIPVHDLDVSPARSLNFILPSKHVKALLKDVLPAKVKSGEVFISVFRRAAGLVNSSPVNWLRVTSAAGELSAPEQEGNYPNFRQVIPRPTIADDAYFMKPGELLTLEQMEKDMDESFKARCLRAACQSAADRGLPFSQAQVAGFIKKAVSRMIRKARERVNGCFWERTPGNRLLPLTLSICPTPAFQIREDGLVLVNGEEDVAICYGANPVAQGNAPAPSAVAFNPAYLIDLNDALTAFDSVPGSPYGPLQAHDALASFSLKSNHPLDSGKGFSFYAVIMPQRYSAR